MVMKEGRKLSKYCFLKYVSEGSELFLRKSYDPGSVCDVGVLLQAITKKMREEET